MGTSAVLPVTLGERDEASSNGTTYAGSAGLNSYDLDASSISTDQRIGVALHEIGHVVGLDHTPSCIGVMYTPSVTCNHWSPSTDDENGIQFLYGATFLTAEKEDFR